jgi:hypothetical protein
MQNVIQPSFSSGELSPELWGRTDVNKYFNGLRTCRNFIPNVTGGVSNRPGTLYVASVKNTGSKWRVIPFIFSVYQAYTIELGKYYARFYANGGQLQDSAGIPVEIATPYSDSDLSQVKYAQSADTLYLVHPNYPPQMITRTSLTSFSIQAIPFINGPFMIKNTNTAKTITPSATTGSITLTANSAIFQPTHVGALWEVIHYIQGINNPGSFGGTGTSSTISVIAQSGWSFTTSGTWAGTIVIDQLLDGGTTWTAYRTFYSSSNFNVNYSDTATVASMYRVRCTSYSSGTCTYVFIVDPYYNNGIVKIIGYTDSQHVTGTVLTALGGTSATSSWAEGAWSSYRGYPSALTFYEDRLVFGCTSAQPQTYWTSNTSDYYNFIVNNTVLATDSIIQSLMSRQLNQINHFIPLGDLIIGTSSMIQPVAPINGTFSSTSIDQSKLPEYRGIANIPTPPFVVGKKIIYVQQAGTILRSTYWQYVENGYDGEDLTVYSSHLFNHYSIVEVAYQQTPNSTIWLVRSDGQLLSCTYLPEQQVLGWAHHDTNYGNDTYQSICTIPQTGYDEIWVVVKRTNGTMIERFVNRLTSTDPADSYFVDCGLTLDKPISITGVQVGANPVLITAPNHGLSNGDHVDIDDINWVPDIDDFMNITQPDQLNGYQFKIANVTTNTFTLQDPNTGDNIDATNYSSYLSGGYVRKAYQKVTDLDHLAGQTVNILANGFPCPKQVVANDGSVTLPFYASRIAVGLPIISDFETMNIDSQSQEGSMIAQLVKIPLAVFYFKDSRSGLVGPNFTSMADVIQRSNEPLGKPIQLLTYEHPININDGYDLGARVCYRQIDPLPVTILAVIPKEDTGGSIS